MLSLALLLATQTGGRSAYSKKAPPSAISAKIADAKACSDMGPAGDLASVKAAVDKFYSAKGISVAFHQKASSTRVLAYIGNVDPAAKSALVFLQGEDFCGSGGCELLVVRNLGVHAEVISNIGPARLPIVVLKSEHHGWHDLGVTVAGGGITNGYMARLVYDGYKYPDNPTVAPAVRMPTTARALLSLPGSACRLG